MSSKYNLLCNNEIGKITRINVEVLKELQQLKNEISKPVTKQAYVTNSDAIHFLYTYYLKNKKGLKNEISE